MKKNHLFGMFAMTAFAFASCSQDEVVTQSPEVNKAIEFGTYVGRDAVSRGSVITQGGTTAGTDNAKITTLSLAEKGFGVFAYYTDEGFYVPGDVASTTDVVETGSLCNFMYNQEVKGKASTTGEGESAVTTYSTTDWSYSPVKYWPNDPGDKLTFFAYAPYDDADNYANASGYDNISFNAQTNMKGDPIITFTVNNIIKDQTDLLFSKTANKDIVKNTGVTVTDEVKFQFAHALARIGFNVRAVTDEVEVGNEELDENTIIVVKKVILSGDEHTQAVDASFTDPSEGAFYKSGTLNLNQQDVNYTTTTTDEATSTTTTTYTANVDWTASDASDNKQIFTLVNDHFVAQTTGTSIYDQEGFILTENTEVLTSGNSATVNKLNTDDSYIMIIPQDLSTDGFYVYVEYDVITQDANLGFNADAENLTYGDLKSKITNHISTQVNINFESGKAYTLNLQLGMTSVKVTADVDTWVDAADTPVDLPKNTEQVES